MKVRPRNHERGREWKDCLQRKQKWRPHFFGEEKEVELRDCNLIWERQVVERSERGEGEKNGLV